MRLEADVPSLEQARVAELDDLHVAVLPRIRNDHGGTRRIPPKAVALPIADEALQLQPADDAGVAQYQHERAVASSDGVEPATFRLEPKEGHLPVSGLRRARRAHDQRDRDHG